MTLRRTAIAVGIIVIAAGAAAGIKWFGASAAMSSGAPPLVPTARVVRGSLTLTVYLQGDLRATTQANLTAPAVGGTLRILSLRDTGTVVAKDDPIMEFDPADQQYAREQAESELLESEQELIKRRAEIKAQEAQDKVGLMTAQFDVRRAALDAAVDADLIPANEFKIHQAELQEVTRNLERLKLDITARGLTAKASLAVLEEKKNRSAMAAGRARQNMENLVLRAPIAGVVSLRENSDASGGMYYEGMTLPAYRVGDTVYSGRPIADVFDVTKMEVRARVNEQERANVSVGQLARIEADSVPGSGAKAKVSSVAGLGRADSRYGPLRQFDVTLELLEPDARLRPGTTVRVLVQGNTIEHVLLLPRQALFEVDGKSTVYARTGNGDSFAPRQVKVLHRTESQIAVEGVEESTEVALVDPVAALKLGGAKAPSSSGPLDVKK